MLARLALRIANCRASTSSTCSACPRAAFAARSSDVPGRGMRRRGTGVRVVVDRRSVACAWCGGARTRNASLPTSLPDAVRGMAGARRRLWRLHASASASLGLPFAGRLGGRASGQSRVTHEEN
jgi:hypothetical protein